MLKTILIAAASLLGAATAASAQTPPPGPPCSAAEYRQMDFWVGDWDLEFDAGGGNVGHAQNHITKDEFGACVIAEHFQQPDQAYIGHSVSIYDRFTKQWRQTWVDNGGGLFVLTGGPVAGQPYVFELKTVDGRGPKNKTFRMIWQDVTPNSLTWRWQSQEVDGSWQDAWVLHYKRKMAAG